MTNRNDAKNIEVQGKIVERSKKFSTIIETFVEKQTDFSLVIELLSQDTLQVSEDKKL